MSAGNIPVYGSGGFMGKYVNKFAYDKPTVLLPRKGTITNVFYLDRPFWNVDTVFYTEINTTKLEPRYLYYQMKTVDLEVLNSGSGRPSLTQSALNEVLITVPQKSVQQKIVKKLDSDFTKIGKLKELYVEELAKITGLKQSILAEAFTL